MYRTSMFQSEQIICAIRNIIAFGFSDMSRTSSFDMCLIQKRRSSNTDFFGCHGYSFCFWP